MTVRVAVVDDDDITRAGLASVLGRRAGISVQFAVSHHEVEHQPLGWDEVDVAIVDAADHRRLDDQYPGVAVVHTIRRAAPPRCTVIVVTGVLFDEAVRHRMREAGADLYYHRTELVDADVLCAIVLGDGPPADAPLAPPSDDQNRAGVTPASRVNDGVSAARELGLTGAASAGVGRGRARVRRREAFNERARLVVINRDGTLPDRVQDAPSMPQISRFLEWATQIPDRRRRSGR